MIGTKDENLGRGRAFETICWERRGNALCHAESCPCNRGPCQKGAASAELIEHFTPRPRLRPEELVRRGNQICSMLKGVVLNQKLPNNYSGARANRSQGGNLSELGGDGMFATFRQQFAPCLLAHVLQQVQPLVELLGSAASSRFRDFSQPLAAMALIVNIPAGTGDRPATIQ